MIPPLEAALRRIFDRQDLTADEMQAAVAAIMDGPAGEAEIAAFLTALRMKGESVGELVGAARAMRERATRITTRQTGLLDTCGTGGDGLRTFNISTATAFVVAACGVPVAKHGNRSMSSASGSADVLEALGVNVQLVPDRVCRCLDEMGLGFCFAPLIHGAMKHAAPVRKQLGFRTVFNLLGPLTNPAGADYQLVGAFNLPTAEKLAGALAQLAPKRAIVVCGAGELDEVSLWGTTTAFLVEHGTVARHEWTARSFGLPEVDVRTLQVNSAAESAAIVRDVFAGKPGPARDIVLANAAVGLMAAGRVADPAGGVQAAAAALDSGKVDAVCRQLVELTNRPA